MRIVFVRYISNSIRNPLNTALLGLKLLHDDMMDADEGDDRLETLHNIRESCNSATDLLDDLLAYDKMESGLSEPEMKVSNWVGLVS